MKLNLREFLIRFPDDETCLDDVFQRRFGSLTQCPKCNTKSKFYRVKKRTCYECGECGHQLYPLAGTVMAKSTTSIKLWYYAIYLFSQSKNGVSAKELERQLGVAYKTAWSIGHKIRKMMAESPRMLQGIVEMDESLYGGKAKGKRGWAAENKTCLFGMIERDGNVKILVIKDRKQETLIPIIEGNVHPEATVHTDKYKVYKQLPAKGFVHKVKNNNDVFTNHMEGYWGNFKRSVAGTHTWVSPRHLQSYVNEFAFRHNHRRQAIFDKILDKMIA